MTDQSIVDELDRYAAVNSMFLKMEGIDSLDVSYQAYVEFMKTTDWDSPAAEGSKYMVDLRRDFLSYAWNFSCYVFFAVFTYD